MIAHLVTTIAALEALVPEWQPLFLADPHTTPFQHPAWLLPWWRHLGEGSLAVVVVRDSNGALTGLLPAYLYTQPDSFRRDLLLLGAGTSDYLGGVFAPPAKPAHIPAADLALATLLEHRGWQLADLHQLRADSPVLAALRRRNLPLAEAEPCALARSDPAARPAKIRLNINRYRHRAESRGNLRLHTAHTPAEALAHLETLIDLHTRRWHERGESGVLASLAIQQQHREAVPFLLAAGLLRMIALYLDDITDPGRPPIAVLYSLVDPPRDTASGINPADRCLYAYLIGINPAFADISPGTLLLAALFEQCAREGILVVDMLRGGETYKRLWGAEAQSTFALRLAAPPR